MNNNIDNYGLRFQNTYLKLSPLLYSQINPVSVRNPELIILNESLSKEIGLDFSQENSKNLSEIFSGNTRPKGSHYISQAYAGHQFGQFTVLGDGRASLMGEHLTPDNTLVDIQLKGSGRTPYSRGGDGRATLGPMLREYLISEAMNSLKIPTTRSLAVVKTGEDVIRETVLKGAILTRVASSHIRVGTYQYLAMNGEKDTILELINYSVNRHYKEVINEDDKVSFFLKLVMNNQINLIINWMRVGFIHGVMNTDNMTISGETIDYGPCAFMDDYNPDTVFSSIDHNGRYSYINQSIIAQWNLARFAETLIPLISDDEKKGIKKASDIINNFQIIYKEKWLEMMRCKIGLSNKNNNDEKLIISLLEWMKLNKVDFTNTFNYLAGINNINIEKYNNYAFKEWINRWHKRLDYNGKLSESSLSLMKKNNPVIIPRNYKVEEALAEVNKNDNIKPLKKLLNVLSNPYSLHKDSLAFQQPPPTNLQEYKTFCGT